MSNAIDKSDIKKEIQPNMPLEVIIETLRINLKTKIHVESNGGDVNRVLNKLPEVAIITFKIDNVEYEIRYYDNLILLLVGHVQMRFNTVIASNNLKNNMENLVFYLGFSAVAILPYKDKAVHQAPVGI